MHDLFGTVWVDMIIMSHASFQLQVPILHQPWRENDAYQFFVGRVNILSGILSHDLRFYQCRQISEPAQQLFN